MPAKSTKPTASSKNTRQNTPSSTSASEKFDLFSDYFFKGIVIFLILILILSFTFLAFMLLFELLGILFFAFSAIALAFMAIWLIPIMQIKKLRGKIKNQKTFSFEREKECLKLLDDNRKTMAQIIGGLFFVLSLFIAYYTFESNKDKQSSERFSSSIKLLENDNGIFVRSGALSDLENLAKDTVKLHPAIMDVLNAYIKARSREIRLTGCYFNVSQGNEDIGIAAKILLGRNTKYDKSDFYADLNGAMLNKADLSFKDFKDLKFDNACFNNANLTGATLTRTSFGSTDIADADFSSANLHGADLSNVYNLSEKQIFEAKFDETTTFPENCWNTTRTALEKCRDYRDKRLKQLADTNKKNY
jgi:uncharacterized protein YjbI with pentapeptide repeats